MEHFVLTRFNVRFKGTSTARIHDSAWLTKRLQLFEQFCLPSIVRQTRLPNAWIVFFDDGTPDGARSQFEEMIRPHAFIKSVYCSDFSPELAAECVRRYASPGCEWLITTRLDNDDAINSRLLETIFECASAGKYEFINAPNGLIIFQDRFYRITDRSSPFISASESIENVKTVMIDQHHHLGRYAPIRQLPLKYAWLQVIHGDNVANRVYGIRVPSGSVDSRSFPSAFATRTRKESWDEIIVDNSFGFAVRLSGSIVRSLLTKTRQLLNVAS
jgi:hypothetical protein